MMTRHITPSFFYTLPSGNRVHPCRLIHKDGTLMWKHALLCDNELVALPYTQAHEQHIIKTAQRLEELNTWVSQHLDPWEFLKPVAWYHPDKIDLTEGISVYFKHTKLDNKFVYDVLKMHLNDCESLVHYDNSILFRRC